MTIDQATSDGKGNAAALALEPAEDEKVYVASSLQLTWWKFRKHRLAMVSGVIIILFYLVGALCEFVAPYDPNAKFAKYKLSPPSTIHIVDANGTWRMPFVNKTTRTLDLVTARGIFTEDPAVLYPLRLFVRGNEYKLLGLFPTDRHLFGLSVDQEEQGVFLFGTDLLGRDVFSRVVYGARLSLSIGLVGVFLSMTLGLLLGGVSGYYGGLTDNLIQRVIEFLRSMPGTPLWMALSAALPADWPIIRVYFGITVILSLLGWTGMARVVRGRFLAMREEDFVMSAKLAGANELRIILRHMLPSFTSHLIASMTLSIPGMIIGETGLSFLGLGLRDPAISWGVLLSDAQNVASLVVSPWRMWAPATAVIIAVLAFNFLGDGLRDAADPYAR
jgi:peptide/nickel transport system permease protein